MNDLDSVLVEKHKAYHQKDELLAKDGFKKFMKYEHCSFPKCRYSKVSNHIHCIRPGKTQLSEEAYWVMMHCYIMIVVSHRL